MSDITTSSSASTTSNISAPDERTSLLRKRSNPELSPRTSFSRNFMVVTLITFILYFTSFTATFFVSDLTLQIIAYTLQGCATMWCFIVWFLHHVWLVENPVKFMRPLHLSPYYYEILRFDSLLEHYEDIRNIAIAGFAACLQLGFAAGFVFWLVASWYWTVAEREVYGWFGEYGLKERWAMEGVFDAVVSGLGWMVIIVWFAVTCKVVWGLCKQMRDIWRMVQRRKAESVSIA